jgi:hypothetical protein
MNRNLVAASLGAMVLSLIAGGVLAANPATPAAPAVAPAAPAPAPAPAPVATPAATQVPAPVAAQPPVPPDVTPEVWPMPVEDFLAGNYLERADVVLTRRNWDFSSWAIRWATKSPFSHAAMVFTGPQFESGYSNTFVIESSTKGVDLTNLRDYIADRSAFLGIKRFKRDWFDETKQARVRGLLLDKIKSTYNYWAIVHIMRNLWFGVQETVQAEKGGRRHHRREGEGTPPNEFICSGLVQIGFVEAVLEYIKAGQLPPSTINDVVFEPEAATRLPDKADWAYLDPESSKTTAVLFRKQNYEALQWVTPEDLASSDKLEWLYFIKDGLVYKVSTYDEVKKLSAD